MKQLLFAIVALTLFTSHDMYLRLDTYFLQSNTEASILLYNGTFDLSENTIDRDRMADVSLVGNGKRVSVDSTQWTERDSTTVLNFTTGEAGTWVAGVSTRARNIAMEAADFNDYLEHDGVVDMLDLRRRTDQLTTDAVERYSKHVKTMFQVGDQRTADWQTTLDYPLEFVPLANPYGLHGGDELSVSLLLRGQPLADQLVYLASDSGGQGHSHGGGGEEHTHAADATQLRTDAEGKINFRIDHDGTWHLRTIHLVESREEGLTHESNWATLTFAVDHGQPHTHAENGDHDHEDGGGIPGYVYGLVSLLLVGGLFFYFKGNA